MSKMSDTDCNYLLTQQYQDSSSLVARINIHERFSTNAQGWHRWVFEQLQLKSKARILEIGCGTGALWHINIESIAPDWDITLSDFSAGMVESAKGIFGPLAKRFTWNIIDAQSIPYGDQSFDVVIANHMLYHVPNRQQALQEVRRILRPSGQFYASANGRDHLREMDDLFHVWFPEKERDNSVEKFGLETGEAQLIQNFSKIALHIYPDTLQVTEVEPLLHYLLSTSAKDVLDEQHLYLIREVIENEFKQKGCFFVTKSSGLFQCWV